MKQKVITIDLKHRSHDESLILDTSNLPGTDTLILNLDFKGILKKVREYINRGKLEESQCEICKVMDSFNACNDSDIYNEYMDLKNVSTNIYIVQENVKKVPVVENYKAIKLANDFLLEHMKFHDISPYNLTYLQTIQKAEQYLEKFDFKVVLQKVVADKTVDEVYSYLCYVMDYIKTEKIDESMDEETLQVFDNISDLVNKYNGELISKYNSKTGRISAIKKLVPYEYGKLIEENTFKIYIKSLKDKYDNSEMEQLRNDFCELFILYKMNSAEDYGEFYENLYIMAEKYSPDFMKLNEYYKKYVSKRMYKQRKKCYNNSSFCKIVSENVESVKFNTDFTVLYV